MSCASCLIVFPSYTLHIHFDNSQNVCLPTPSSQSGFEGWGHSWLDSAYKCHSCSWPNELCFASLPSLPLAKAQTKLLPGSRQLEGCLLSDSTRGSPVGSSEWVLLHVFLCDFSASRSTYPSPKPLLLWSHRPRFHGLFLPLHWLFLTISFGSFLSSNWSWCYPRICLWSFIYTSLHFLQCHLLLQP